MTLCFSRSGHPPHYFDGLEALFRILPQEFGGQSVAL